MKVLFENKNLIFAVKPRGVSSQSSNGDNMISLLSEQTGGEIYPVHRLDTATGGVMVYAKNKKYAASLSDTIAKNHPDKRYWAIVRGQIDSEGVMEDFLWHDKIKNKSFVVKSERKGAKKASLEYKVIAENEINGEIYTLVEIKLHTGRTHQIRVQFASRGHSLVGDGKYGGKSGYPLALWCHSLTLPNGMSYSCLPPENEVLWEIFNEK
ncbi:MAG: RluA family pseudouridine synthase [Clostridia bacterium]|nr:RluA family pseudouridine synthase [Clostridia bacterium]